MSHAKQQLGTCRSFNAICFLSITISLSACSSGGDGSNNPAATTYTISTSAGPNGSINPASATVNENDTTSFTVTPDVDYSIDSVSGCNGSLNGNTYTTGAITSDCTVSASFISNPSPTYDVNGNISGHTGDVVVDLILNGQPGGSVTILQGDTTFSFTNVTHINDSYLVTTSAAPANQECTVTDMTSGTVAGNVNGVTIYCTEWLYSHNQLRQQLNNGSLPNSPAPSTSIGNLQWDPKLAQVAQTYANGCVFAHNTNRTLDYQALGGTASYVGENIAMISNNISTPTPQQFLNLWAAEESQFVYEQLTTTSVSNYGHYSQLIWRNTTLVGCGVATCSSNDIAVCNYAPGGNYIGQYPY